MLTNLGFYLISFYYKGQDSVFRGNDTACLCVSQNRVYQYFHLFKSHKISVSDQLWPTKWQSLSGVTQHIWTFISAKRKKSEKVKENKLVYYLLINKLHRLIYTHNTLKIIIIVYVKPYLILAYLVYMLLLVNRRLITWNHNFKEQSFLKHFLSFS